MATYKLISFDVCPYVQRSAIVMQHKGVPYETEFVDLRNKPEWFLALSPLGKVPVLVVDDGERREVLFESAIIAEYLDEVTDGSMLPSQPLPRARHRAMVEVAAQGLADQWRMIVAEDFADAKRHADRLGDKLSRFETDLVGPFFAGDELSLVDTATIPLLLRTLWLDEIGPELGLFDGLPRVLEWARMTAQLESVRLAAVPDLRERIEGYLAAFEGSWFAERQARCEAAP